MSQSNLSAMFSSARSFLPVRTACLWAVLSGAWSPIASAHALECTLPASAKPTLSAHSPEARLDFIHQALRAAARSERRYAIGWSLTYTGLAAGTWLFVPLSNDPRQWMESAFNSGTSTFAALTALIGPVGVIRDQQRLERLLEQTESGADRCATLAHAERLLRHAADNQHSARSAFAHISSFAFNIGLGLVLGYGLERPRSAALNTTIGIALGELMIATRPRQALRSQERYLAGDLRTESEHLAAQLSIAPLSVGTGYGVALLGSF